MQDRMAHQYKPGLGYVQVGRPPVPMARIANREVCEPGVLSANGSLHLLAAPGNGPVQTMSWDNTKREWSPLNMMAGNRLGWTSEYLAAHGWAYVGPTS